MDEMIISVPDLLAAIIRKGKRIIFIGIAFAVLLGALKGITSWISLHDENQLDLERLEYDQEVIKLERSIEKATEDADKKQDYIENSLWMDINPYNKYEASLYLSIVDVDETSLNMSFGDNETPIDYLTKRIAAQYSILWSSFDLSSELGLARFENILDKYVREVVSMSILDDGMLRIIAVGNSETEARETVDAAYRLLQSHSAAVKTNSYFHNLEEFNYVLKNQIDTNMADLQAVHYNQLDGYNDTIIEAENTLKTLNPPDSVFVASIKMAIIGGFVGVLLACVWYGGKVLVLGVLQSSSQAEQAFKIPFMGSIAVSKGLFSCIANRISGERVWENEEIALGYISETVKLREPNGRVLLLSSQPVAPHSQAVQKIQNTLTVAGQTVNCVGDFSHNPNALLQLGDCDAVILVETVEKSKLNNISEILRFCKELDKRVLGFVMI